MPSHPSQTISGDLEISKNIVLNLNFKIIKFVENHHTPVDLIGGPNETVEIDETGHHQKEI